MSKLEDFGGNEQLADEYSDEKTCSLSDSGYHCSCYGDDRFKRECCLCEQRKENFYRGPVKAPIDFSKHLVIEKETT